MELLYIWINQSENNVFENQGINLSPEFNFVVDVTETGVYFNILKSKSQERSDLVFGYSK